MDWKLWALPPGLASGMLSFNLQKRKVLDLPRAMHSWAWEEVGKAIQRNDRDPQISLGVLGYHSLSSAWLTHCSFWSFCLSFMVWEQNSIYCSPLVLLEPLSPWILVSCVPHVTSPVWSTCPFLTMAISTRVLTSTAYRVAFPSRIS